ncbi:hypothetical protein [Microbulbifer sp. SAOS-129_SWC]|uniref:hypothetical protein n=1 Tax=Microbulbifer sp. SAOS-129_SWC TaxID=3145235 RepID=UPI0032180535
MALWKQALAKLRGAADAAQPAEVEVEAAANENSTAHGSDVQEGIDRSALARALQSGIEVSIGDLDACGAGWRYRGHPVMVFGTEAPELEDADKRRDFYSLVHLFPCCGALQTDQRSAWAGSDLQQINAEQGQGPFRFCKVCVEAAAGRGADPATFDFAAHVRSHGDSFFTQSCCYWAPGSNTEPLNAPVGAAGRSCPHCGCAASGGGWQLHGEDAQHLAQEQGTCLLCAERRVDGCLHLASEQLLAAARIRYDYLIGQTARAPAPSWKLAQAILPLGWQPLLRSLERVLPPPALFFEYADSAPAAILAWPSLRRGVVEHLGDGQVPDWNLWSRAQIETELGFKMR